MNEFAKNIIRGTQSRGRVYYKPNENDAKKLKVRRRIEELRDDFKIKEWIEL